LEKPGVASNNGTGKAADQKLPESDRLALR
jgi:hypothetical protein